MMQVKTPRPTFPRRCIIGLAGLLVLLSVAGAQAGGPPAVEWQPWTPQVFERARSESRLVLLDVVAEWCRYCEKMERTTFRDPRVLEMIGRHYIAVRADFDQVPEIRKRYGDYGVPAVMLFNAEGEEIMRRRGYLEPEWLYWMLVAVADNPDPAAHR